MKNLKSLALLALLTFVGCSAPSSTPDAPQAEFAHEVLIYATKSNNVWFPTFSATGGGVPVLSFGCDNLPEVSETNGQEIIYINGDQISAGLVLSQINGREKNLKFKIINSEAAKNVGLDEGITTQ